MQHPVKAATATNKPFDIKQAVTNTIHMGRLGGK
jgi:hypothetical protein